MRKFFYLALLLLAPLAGCGKSVHPNTHSPSGSALSSTQVTADVLGILSDLDTTVNLEMRPMRPIVDHKSSSNHDIVQAKLLKEPNHPDAPCVLLQVVSDNTKFKELPVQPGDWVRVYFEGVKDGETVKDHKDLEVADVLGDTELLLQQGPPEPITTPQTIEVWRRMNNKLAGLKKRVDLWVTTGQPNHDWEPTPDEEALHQVVERLNQSLAGKTAPADWQPDPLVAKLPDELRELPPLKNLGGIRFAPEEGRLLEEAVWLRDISHFAADGAKDEQLMAAALFDWTIRHVQVETREGLHGLWRRPWQTLMFGKGTAEDRAWVFALLARQQGLDVVILSPGEAEDKSDKPKEEANKESGKDGAKDSVTKEPVAKSRPVLAGVLIRKQLYLFDPTLGVPVPGANGKGIATLDEAAKDDAILRQLDLDENRVYPWKAADLATVASYVVASPFELTVRAAELERAGKDARQLFLSAEPAAIAKKLENVEHVSAPRLWPVPFETWLQQSRYDSNARQVAVDEILPYVSRPALWKARLLDFKRAPASELKAASRKTSEVDLPGLEIERRVKELYMKVREEDEMNDWIAAEVLSAARADAAYWLGQIALDRGNFPIAKDYFGKHTLDRNPGSGWTHGARYNLARAYEGAGDAAAEIEAGSKNLQSKNSPSPAAVAEWTAAITWYEGRSPGPPSPQELGNHWRAKELKAKLGDAKGVEVGDF